MTDLRGLIQRCEKAAGPERELDAQIYIWVHGLRANAPVLWTQVAPYTNSVDAALALVEKMRPGSGYELKGGHFKDQATVWLGEVETFEQRADFAASAPTLPLAIILALLRSLDSQGVGE